MLESYNDTNSYISHQAAKRVSLISPEYALGRLMPTFLLNNDLEKNYKNALAELDFELSDV